MPGSAEGTFSQASQRSSSRAFETAALRSDHQVNSSFAPISRATTSAIRFSNPSERSLENGMVFGSAQTRRTRGSAARAVAVNRTLLRKRKNVQHSSFSGVFAQVRHRVSHAKRCGAVLGIDSAGDDGAVPAAYPRKYRHILLVIGTLVSHGLADDAGAYFELPEQIAVMRVEGFEPAVHGAVEDHVSGGGHHSAPCRKGLFHGPDRLGIHRVPGTDRTAVTAGTGVHLHDRTDKWRTGDVIGLQTFKIHAEVVMGDVHPAGPRGKRGGLPVLATWRGGTDLANGSEAGGLGVD